MSYRSTLMSSLATLAFSVAAQTSTAAITHTRPPSADR